MDNQQAEETITIEVPDEILQQMGTKNNDVIPQFAIPAQPGTQTPTVTTTPYIPTVQTVDLAQGSIMQAPVTEKIMQQPGTVTAVTDPIATTQQATETTDSERNSKGQFVAGNPTQFQPGNTANVGNHNAGRKSKCTEEILQKAKDYFNKCKNGSKQQIPFTQELALELAVSRDTLHEWKIAKNEDGSKKYPEFSDLYESIEALQELALLKRGIGGKAMSFNMFLLKTKYNYIETDKQILAGDANAPLEIVIVEEKRDYDSKLESTTNDDIKD